MLTNSYRSFHESCAIETGLSDFHEMIFTVMKSYFHKKKSKIIKYRDYSNFFKEECSQHILNEMSNRALDNSNNYNIFLNICKDAIDERAPIKRKYLRFNQSPFMNKDISKAIMNRTRLRYRFLKSMSFESKAAYSKQRNYCVLLVGKTKTDYYNNLESLRTDVLFVLAWVAWVAC